jgi:glutamine amidotransferase
MRIAILDYGAGNLHSLTKALTPLASDTRCEADPLRCLDADLLVLPGVGSFTQAASHLAPAREAVRAAIDGGLPVIGVCLGMQLLFDASDEGPGAGLGAIPGRVTRLRAERVPQIGWNAIEDSTDPALVAARLWIAYYANSFACRPDDASVVGAWSTHGEDRFPAMVRSGRAVRVQFHPEKSSGPGLRFLAAVVEECSA